MAMIQLDIQPSLQNIQARQAMNPLSAYIQGQQQGQQLAVQQNALSTIQRQNEARQFIPGAINGNQNALNQVAQLSPELATQIEPLHLAFMQRTGAQLAAAKEAGPDAWKNMVMQISQETGEPPDPHELDYNNADAVIAQHQNLSDWMDTKFKQQSLDLQKGSQQIQLATLQKGIAQSDRSYNLDVLKANADAAAHNQPPIVPGFQGTDPSAPRVAAAPPMASPPQTTAQPIPQPQGGAAPALASGAAPALPAAQETAAQPPQKINGFNPVVAGKPLQSPYGGTPIYPNAITASMANGIMAGQFPPDDMRLGPNAAAVKASLASSGYDYTKAREDWLATQKNIQTMNGSKMLGMRQAISQLEDSIPLARQLATQWQQQQLSGRFPVLNAASISAAMNGVFGEEAQVIATKLSAQISHMSPELGVIYKNGTTATDAAMEKADQQLKGNWSLPQLMGAFDLVEQNMAYRKNSLLQPPLTVGGQPVGSTGVQLAPGSQPSNAAGLKSKYGLE